MSVNSFYAILAAGMTGDRVIIGSPSSEERRLRILAYRLDVTGDATVAVAGPQTYALYNAHWGAFHLAATPYLPIAPPAVPPALAFTTGWVDLGEGILFERVSEELQMTFSAPLTSGLVTLSVLYSDEDGGAYPAPRPTDIYPMFVNMNGGDAVSVQGQWFSPDLAVSYTATGTGVTDLSVQPTVVTFTSGVLPLPGSLSFASLISLHFATATGERDEPAFWAFDPAHLPLLASLDVPVITEGDTTLITATGTDLDLATNGMDDVTTVGFFLSPPPAGRPYPTAYDLPETYGLTGWSDAEYGSGGTDPTELEFTADTIPAGTYYVVPGIYVDGDPVFHGTATTALLTIDPV